MLRVTHQNSMRPQTPKARSSAVQQQRWRRRRQRTLPRCPAVSNTAEAAQLLDQFWLAQGVVDEAQRRQLIAAAGSLQQLGDSDQAYEGLELPSLSAAWFLADGGNSPEVATASRRILALQQLLGGSGVDVVWMLVREPRLLSADFRSIMQRLFDMKVAEGSEGVDVVRVVEQQPALLLQADAAGAAGSDETAAQRLRAWQHGLVSDGSSEWARRYAELRQYGERYGDAHVGFRDGDCAELSRWAAKQRSTARAGHLEADQREALEAAGFEFDGERAEWLRWLNEIRAFHSREGHCQPQPLAHPNDFLLINWTSVQRIMRRCGVLAEERVAMLDALGFDWSGADPLS